MPWACNKRCSPKPSRPASYQLTTGALSGRPQRFLAWAPSESKLPGLFTEFQGHIQDACRFVIMSLVGRCRGHGLSPPWWSGEGEEKKRTNRGPLSQSTGKHSIYLVTVVVPRRAVALVAKTPPSPLTSAIVAGVTWRRSASCRSCRTASMIWSIPSKCA